MANLKSLDIKPLPKPLALKDLIGPSFIILGLGLGSGEVILWPYLSSHYGLGIIWGALFGITIQFFVNMEVERYALINGESIFVGFARMARWLPLWFILSTFLGFGWPGIGLAGATVLAHIFGVSSPTIIAVIIFLIIGLILSFGKVLYTTVETLQKWLIGIGVPAIFCITLFLAHPVDYQALALGIVGSGDGFQFLPEGIVLLTFLGALAYSGAGGNLNLAQSFYVRDKGYGMGAYAQKITSLFRSGEKQQKVSLTGATFDPTPKNIKRFNQWWRVVNIEHAVVFWALGLSTMLLLALLAYTTTYGKGVDTEGISFVLEEAYVMGVKTLPVVGTIFLVVIGVMLSATQLTVLDSTSRIITENIALLWRSESPRISLIYYIVLWIQILFGITIFLLGFNQPLTLIILGAVINAFAMFVYIGLLLRLNNTRLHASLRPSLIRNFILIGAFIFFGVFSTITIVQYFNGA